MNSPEYSLTDLSPPQTARIPGDLAMWCFILAELLAFLLLLGSMAFARGHWEQMFSAGIATLHPEAGLINTLILLAAATSPPAVSASAPGPARALGRGFTGCAVRAGLCRVKLNGALLFGAATTCARTFYFFYFFTTFFHMAHVLIGMVILLVVARRYRTGQYPNADKARMASNPPPATGTWWTWSGWCSFPALCPALRVKMKTHALEIGLAGLVLLTLAMADRPQCECQLGNRLRAGATFIGAMADRQFMELRHAPAWLRWVVSGWLVLIVGMTALFNMAGGQSSPQKRARREGRAPARQRAKPDHLIGC